jgi:hypothetical protein
MEYRYKGHALSGSQSFVCRESRKSVAMIKGSLYICDDYCATSCDAEGIANVAGFFSFANPSRFFFLSQNLQIFGLALCKKAQYVAVSTRFFNRNKNKANLVPNLNHETK